MIQIQVQVEFITTKEGGRMTPILTEYRPNFVFGFAGQLDKLKTEKYYRFDDSNWTDTIKSIDGKMYPENGSASPGECINAKVIFRDTDYIDEFLNKDESFLVREGGRVVATGKIMES